MKIDQHHLLECILWPNGDGTFRKIINTADRLKELGVYNDYKLTIPIEHGAHTAMHIEFKKGTSYEWAGKNHPMYGKGYLIAGEKNPMYGKKHTEEARRKMSESSTGEKNSCYGRTGNKNPMYGMTGEKHPNWKGDNVTPIGAYQRALKLYKAGKLTEEEFKPYRDADREYRRERRATRYPT